MRGEDEGALCLSGAGRLAPAPHAMPTEAHSHQDKHKAPTQPRIHPLSLQDTRPHPSLPCSVVKYSSGRGRPAFHSPIRLSKFIRMDGCTLPGLIVNVHQDTGGVSRHFPIRLSKFMRDKGDRPIHHSRFWFSNFIRRWYADFQDKQCSGEQEKRGDGKDHAIPQGRSGVESDKVNNETAHSRREDRRQVGR